MNCVRSATFALVLTLLGCFSLPTAWGSQGILKSYFSGKPIAKGKLEALLLNKAFPPALLQPRSAYQLRLLRNSIFALQGARFRSPHLQKFFAKQSWYKPTRAPSKITLSPIAKQNIALLIKATTSTKALDGPPLGEMPSIASSKRKSYCLVFQRYTLHRSSTRGTVIRRRKGKGCSAGKVVLRIRETDEQPRGLYRGFLLTRIYGGSDVHTLKLYKLSTGKVAFHRSGVSPQTRFFFKGDRFFYDNGIGFHKACKKNKQTYAAREKACWPYIQKKHVGLKSIPAPKCHCGPSGLEPYPIVRWSVALQRLKTKPIASGPARCGCSS